MGIVYTNNYYAINRALQNYKTVNSTTYYPYKTPSIGTKFIDVNGTERSNITTNTSYTNYQTALYEYNADLYYHLNFKTLSGGVTGIRVGTKPSSWNNTYDVPNIVSDYSVNISNNQTSYAYLTVYSPIVITITNNGSSSFTFNCIGQARSYKVFTTVEGTSSLGNNYLFLLWAYELDSDVTLQPGETYTFSVNLPTTEFTGG